MPERIRAELPIQNLVVRTEPGQRLVEAFNRFGLVSFEVDYSVFERRMVERCESEAACR